MSYQTITVDIDVDDLVSDSSLCESILERMDDEDILDYCERHGLTEFISPDFNQCKDQFELAEQLVSLLSAHMRCYNRQDLREAFESLLTMTKLPS